IYWRNYIAKELGLSIKYHTDKDKPFIQQVKLLKGQYMLRVFRPNKNILKKINKIFANIPNDQKIEFENELI
ncbi:MAG: hypothetical protein KKC77_19615, partial [Proteobacteria bacterium]|nr:hypothetical protein [Pseudomonadota bacterium]